MMPAATSMILLLLACSGNSEPEPEPGPAAPAPAPTHREAPQARFVTADGLAVRAAPATDAARLNVVPLGTSLATVPTDQLLDVDGVEVPWHHVPALSGYVAGHYLSTQDHGTGDPYLLGRDSIGLFWHSVERMELARGRVLIKARGSEESGFNWRMTQAGTYRMVTGGIELALETGSGENDLAGEDLQQGIERLSDSPVSLEAKTVKLVYQDDLGAFVVEGKDYVGEPDPERCGNVKIDDCAHGFDVAPDGTLIHDQCPVVDGWWCYQPKAQDGP